MTTTPQAEGKAGAMWGAPLVYVDDFPNHPELKGIVGALVTHDHELRGDKITIRASMVTEEDGLKFCLAVNNHASLEAENRALKLALKQLLADGGPLSDPISRKQAQEAARSALSQTTIAEDQR